MTSTAPHAGADLDTVLALRLRRSLVGTPLLARRATVVLDAGEPGVWTVEVGDGRARARRGSAADPTLLVHGSAPVLADVVSGRTSGVHAFLDGRVTVRGDLALWLQLDSLLEESDDPEKFRGIDILRAIRSFDPCMPCTTHIQSEAGMITREVNTCACGLDE